MEDQKKPIYHNLFFDDIKKKINNYVKFKKECVEIAILAEVIQNENDIDFKFISIIDPNILRNDNINPRDSAHLDSVGYVYHWNSPKQDFMSFIERIVLNDFDNDDNSVLSDVTNTTNNQLPNKYIIFQGYIDKDIDIKANESNENILSKLSIRKILWNVDDNIQKWMTNDYSEKNTIFNSYLAKATKIEKFTLNMKDVNRFIEEIKKEIRTNPNNVNFKNVKPITEKINETMVDYAVINYIIQYSFPNNAEEYNKTYLNNIPKNNEYIRDYLYYFAYDKPSYTISDLIKDSFMTIKLDKIIIETEENGKKQKKPINLKSNKSLDNLNMIFDIPYFKKTIEENKTKKNEEKKNIFFLFYEMLLKFYNIFDTYIEHPINNALLCIDNYYKLNKDADFFKKIYIPLNELACIFYKCSVEYVSDTLALDPDYNKETKNKYNELKFLMKISIIDSINNILHNLLIKTYNLTNKARSNSSINQDKTNFNFTPFDKDTSYKILFLNKEKPICLYEIKEIECEYIDKNVLNPIINKDKPKLKYLRDNVELFISEIEHIFSYTTYLSNISILKYQPNNTEIIQDLEKEIVDREIIMNKIIDIKQTKLKTKNIFKL